jgi:hypothetical protein
VLKLQHMYLYVSAVASSLSKRRGPRCDVSAFLTVVFTTYPFSISLLINVRR